MITTIVANAKIIFAILIHLHNVRIRDIRDVKNITKRRKMSLLLNSCLNM